jgi:uncharacterized protein YaaN involved in tellurite resistance
MARVSGVEQRLQYEISELEHQSQAIQDEIDKLAESKRKNWELAAKLKGILNDCKGKAREVQSAPKRSRAKKKAEPAPDPAVKETYECPTCHKYWTKDQLKASGKGKDTWYWCPEDETQIEV